MAFQKEDTAKKIIEIISKKLSFPKEQLTPSAAFKDLGIDSLDNVELMIAFEDAFGVEIPDEEAQKITTIQNAIDVIHEARKK